MAYSLGPCRGFKSRPLRHISIGCELSSDLPSRSTPPSVTERATFFSWMYRLSRFAASRRSSSLMMLYRSKTDQVLRTKKPRTRLHETMFSSPYMMTDGSPGSASPNRICNRKDKRWFMRLLLFSYSEESGHKRHQRTPPMAVYSR